MSPKITAWERCQDVCRVARSCLKGLVFRWRFFFFLPPPTTLLSERGEQLLVRKTRVLWRSGSVRCRVYFSMSNVKRIHPKSVRAESET